MKINTLLSTISSAVVDSPTNPSNIPDNENWWVSETTPYQEGFWTGFFVAIGCWIVLKLFKLLYRWIINKLQNPGQDESDK